MYMAIKEFIVHTANPVIDVIINLKLPLPLPNFDIMATCKEIIAIQDCFLCDSLIH